MQYGRCGGTSQSRQDRCGATHSSRGPVAQLAEQQTLNLLVEGSIPSGLTTSSIKSSTSTAALFSTADRVWHFVALRLSVMVLQHQRHANFIQEFLNAECCS
jgi:hypothetical protein